MIFFKYVIFTKIENKFAITSLMGKKLIHMSLLHLQVNHQKVFCIFSDEKES